MTNNAKQLPLGLNLSEHYSLSNFYFKQTELQAALTSFTESDEFSFLYLWGGKSTGKSHLALAMTAQAALQGQTAYLPLTELISAMHPDVLQRLEKLRLVCIDDIHLLNGEQQWQEALFHCFNRLQQSNSKLLVTATVSPLQLTLQLADLRSRLASGLTYQLDALSDDDKRFALLQQAKIRGLELTDEVISYLLNN